MRKLLVLASLLLFASFATAAVITLDFEGLQNGEEVLEFYNGGLGSFGSGPGPNYGISFGANSTAAIDSDNGGGGNFANEPSPDTAVIFLAGQDAIINVPAGFDTGFSFYYSSATNGSVTVYDGLNSTGNILGTINIAINYRDGHCTGDPTGDFCHWDPMGLSFNGIAKSVNFSGASVLTVFDNITLGSPSPVPEPTTLALLGSSGLAIFLRRRW